MASNFLTPMMAIIKFSLMLVCCLATSIVHSEKPKPSCAISPVLGITECPTGIENEPYMGGAANKVIKSSLPEFKGKRVALIVGNSKYDGNADLPNPVNDAQDLADVLKKKLGFQVYLSINDSQASFQKMFDRFLKKLNANAGALAVVYFAGHGFQQNNVNYLLPSDFDFDSKEVKSNSISLIDLQNKITASGVRLGVALIDACRDNPFSEATRSLSRTVKTRGLANMENDPSFIVGYATSPGKVALDGDGRNSPYAQALITTLAAPGQGLSTNLINAMEKVATSTKRKQIPWLSTSADGNLCLNGCS